MFHIFARAGWTIAPKMLKENMSSVIMSIAMGAALQYAAPAGDDFYVNVDLHQQAFGYPGHSLESLRSGLLMSYWLGADTIYIENLDFPGGDQRHPEAGPGSLIHWTDDDHYQITPHGQIAKSFFREYAPSRPRSVDWRSYRPRVAFIRLPDGAWGQRDSFFRDRLLGNRDMPMDEISAEWLHVWPILTHGVVRDGAISVFNRSVYPTGAMEDFFVPIDSVAMFDHMVEGPVLDSVRCFIVCGHALSARTFEEIRRRVGEGAARCIIARRLYDQHADAPLPGAWVIVDDFTDNAVAAALEPFLGPPDVARFRFEDRVVEFYPEEQTDAISVRVFERSMIGEIVMGLLGRAPFPPDSDLNDDGRIDIADLINLMNRM